MVEEQREKKPEFSQDQKLYTLWKNELECTVITTNGVQMRGKIESFDRFVVLIRSQSGKQSMIYKHALSTIY